MREIKFRIWNDKVKEMGIVFGLDYPEPLELLPHYIVMQYTGLKDKNGVEIYEGDILQDGDIKIAVEWNSTMAMFWGVTPTQRPWTDCEVIGNIYQDKELLK